VISIPTTEDVERMVLEALAKLRPQLVHQRSVEHVVGIPRRQYLADAAARHFPTTKQRRLIVARTADVVGFYEQRIELRDVKPVNDSDPEAIALARVGARRIAP
jgi:hypothetical protein